MRMRRPRLTISRRFRRVCEAQAREAFPLETGGAFMGRAKARGDLVVEHLIGAGPDAVHRRSSFTPDAGHQWAEMARLHASTQGRAAFLGDWHTHPRGDGGLSPLDLDALDEILRSPLTPSRSIVSAILAGGRCRWRWTAHLATLGADGLLLRTCGIVRV